MGFRNYYDNLKKESSMSTNPSLGFRQYFTNLQKEGQKEYIERQAKIAAEYVANQKAYDDLLNFDVNAGQDEINNLEAILKKANELNFSPTAPTKAPTTVTRNGTSYSVDSKGNFSIVPSNTSKTRVEVGYALRDSAEKAKVAQYEYLKENGYSSVDELRKAINQKKQYLNDAKSTQSTHAALSKYNKTQEENGEEINSLYTDMGTKKANYEENGKSPLDWISKGIAAFMYGDSPKNIAVSNEENEYMSASEKYYTAKYGTKAEQQELLNIFKQSGDSKYSQEIKELTHSLYGDSAFDEYVVGNVESGARNFFYETAATFNAITSIFGLPIDETKAYQDLKKSAGAQNAYASNAAIALGDTDNIGGNLIQVAMAFIPDLILTVATKGSSGSGATAKSLGKIASAGIKTQKTASMTNKFLKYGSGMLDAVSKGISATAKNPMFWTSFSRTFGTDYETALEGGADTATAYLYATITSITNALVEIGGGVESRLPDVISGKSKFQILDFIKECIEEGNEEVIQGVITNLNQLLYDSDKEFFSLENEDAIINPSRMLKEHAMGTLGGAVLGGGTKIGQRIISGSTRGITIAGKSAIRNNMVSDLAEFGRTAADENVRSVSESFLTSGKITNYDAGVLFAHAQKQINYDLNLAKTPAKTRAAIQKYIKGDYPEAIKQMVIGNEIAKMYDISGIASKVSQREYSFLINEDKEGIISNEENIGGELNGSENAGLLAGREISTADGSGNTLRQQGNDSKALSGELGTISTHKGKHDVLSEGWGTAWLASGNLQPKSQVGSGPKKSFLRTLREKRPSGTDTKGRPITQNNLERLGETVFKDEDGNIIVLYHWTPNKFKLFKQGDGAFHLGTITSALAIKSQSQTNNEGFLKECYVLSKNPLIIKDDGFFTPANVVNQLIAKDIITKDIHSKIIKMEGFYSNEYDSPANNFLRQYLKDIGFDSYLYINKNEGAGMWSVGVFDADQIITVAENGVLKQENATTTKEKSIFPELDLTDTKPQSFEEMAMANITGEKLRNENQKTVESIARLLNQKVDWYENPDENDRGYYENGVIHINKKANQPYTVVFTHEFLHHLQNTKAYEKFTEFVMGTNSYKIWIAQNGGYEAFSQIIKTTYEAREGKPMSETRLRYEIMARFISEGFFTEADFKKGEKAYNLFEEIAQNHKWYRRVMDWFAEMINRLRRRSVQADFIKMQRLLKAAYSQVQSRAAQVDGGREYDADNVIDLSSDNELLKKVEGIHGNQKYKIIQNYILEALNEQPIQLSDGKEAFVDKSDAQHIASNSGQKKTSQIAQIKKVIETAKLVAEENSTKIGKFDYFYYYKATVKMNGEVYPIYVNVGRARNDAKYHIYDITQKIRDTAHRVNDVGRPVGYALKSDISNDSIRDSAENSKENFKNRDYSFDISENLPSKLLANDLIADTGSSFDSTALAAEVEKIYAALDEGNTAAAYIIANNIAQNILSNTENGENWGSDEIAGKDATERLTNHIVQRAQEAEEITLKKARNENQNLQKEVDSLKKEGGNAELDRKQIRAEERQKFEAAQQRQTDIKMIKQSVNRLDTKFRANSNKKHVPEVLKDAVKLFLEVFLKNDPRAFNEKKLHRIRAMYEQLGKENPELTIDPDTKEKLDYLARVMEKKTVSKLSDTELQMVREISAHFEHLVTSANEIFVEGKKEDFRALATDEAEKLKKKPQKHFLNLGDGKLRQGIDKAKEFFIEGNLKPVYFFEKLDGVYKKLYDDISAGLDTTIRNIEQAKNKLQETIKKYNYWSWVDKNQKIELGHVDGVRMSLTLGEAMSIVAIHKREQSNAETQGSNHLGVGGIVLKRRQIVEQIEKAAKDKSGSLDALYKHQMISAWASSPYKITESDIKEIKKQLGKEKLAFIDELVEYMSTVGSALGNDASDKLYGYNKFGEKYYFPFETSKKFLARELESRQANKTLTNRSFTKNTVEEATSPLVISDFMEVFCKHMTEMCEYNGLAVPLNNLKRVCGFVDKGDEKRAGFALMNELERVHGKAAVNYLDAFIKSVDGGVEGQQAGDSLTGSLISLFQKNAVAANLSVVIQQPSSIMRAVAYIEPKYLFAKGAKFTKEAWEECKQHNSIAIQKEMGRFDIGNPKSTFDYMTDRQYKGLKDKAKGFVKDENYRDNLLSKAASKADQYTWCTIWNGCKAKIEATTDFEVGSEQFFTEAEKLFKEVIEHTQVYDSVLSRSQNMRSQSMLTRMATAFMGEPTTNLNMLHKALWDAKAGNMGAATKGVIGVFSATLLNAILKSLITAMRDDDEDKSYGEKYITEVGGNFLSDANPIGWVPIMKDVLSIFEGYQVKRADMNLVQDLYYGLSALSSTKKTTWEKILAVANPVSAMCGLPVENVARDIGAVINTVTTAVNDENEHTHGFKYAFLEGLPGEDSYAKYYEIMRDKQKKGDTQGYTELKEYLMGRGKTEKEIESGVKAAYSKSKAVAKHTDDYFAKLAQNALFGNLSEEKQADVKTAVKRYLTESAMNAATGKEMSKTNQKAAEAQKNGSSAVNYFLAKASFEDTDNSGGISNEEKIAAINKMNISAFEKQALIMLYTKK